ncbi:MAG: hypothetical protein BWY62_00638 [Firmicutes bacterium ADurb.Bin356]|nr:MAG: hypothetical protein BWY62_00638 [Firmicutes bacterium ADurb.Bin356]
MPVGSICMQSPGVNVAFAPILHRISLSVLTSSIQGRFSRMQHSPARIEAGTTATAAFFAPLIVTAPSRGRFPFIWYHCFIYNGKLLNYKLCLAGKKSAPAPIMIYTAPFCWHCLQYIRLFCTYFTAYCRLANIVYPITMVGARRAISSIAAGCRECRQ